MSFATYDFLLTFLPAAVLLAWLATWVSARYLLIPAILAASIAFYAYSSIPHLILLLSLIGVTWLCGVAYARFRPNALGDFILSLGVLANLSALLVWKYSGSLVETWNTLGWIQVQPPGFIMPLGISFYALQQIGYLLDLRRGRAQGRPLPDYTAFVLFFPQLLAGPIVTQKRMMKEFDRVRAGIPFPDRVDLATLGLAWITIGLFKKTVIADSLARLTVPLITKASVGELSLLEAWQIGLAGAPRIYFDFSGYSDMAVGIGLLFGVRLPANFNAPFRPRSIREAWARWHITFHHFVRDHVYRPLRNRLEGVPLGLPIVFFLIFAVSALWHGDSLQYIVWGLLIWVLFVAVDWLNMVLPRRLKPSADYISRVILTLLLPLIFMAPDLEVALFIAARLVDPSGWATTLAAFSIEQGIVLVGLVALLVIMKREIATQILLSGRVSHPERTFYGWRPPAWSPSLGWAIFLGVLMIVSFHFVGLSPPFFYFKF
ncbi:MAG: MBOAT family O-acyltransferase [Pseudomonadota bacterium]